MSLLGHCLLPTGITQSAVKTEIRQKAALSPEFYLPLHIRTC